MAIKSQRDEDGKASTRWPVVEKLQGDPFSGCLFAYRSRRGTSIRVLVAAELHTGRRSHTPRPPAAQTSQACKGRRGGAVM
jgi:hypothetical protein